MTSVCQDKSGYLWIATSTAVARFDGTRFVNYTPSDFRSPPGFSLIMADNDGGILLAPFAGGLLKLENGRFEQCSLPEGLESRIVTGMLRDDDGSLWVGFKGGLVVQKPGKVGAADRIIDLSSPNAPEADMQIAHDGGGQLWLSNGKVLYRLDSGEPTSVTVRGKNEHLRIISSKEGGLWVFSDEWLVRMDGDDPVPVAKTNGFTSAHYIQSAIEDRSGRLWLGTRFRGLRRMTPGGETTHAIERPGDVLSVFEDAAGNIWAGTNGDGLIRLRSTSLRLLDRTYGFMENYSLTVCQDGSGTMWFANRDGGLAYLNESGRLVFLDKPHRWENFSIFSIAPRPRGVLATSTQGVLEANTQCLSVRYPMSSLPPNTIMRVSFTAKDESFWVAFAAGRLGRLCNDNWTYFGKEQGLPEMPIRSIGEDAHGAIHIGFENAGLYRYANGRFDSVPITVPAPVGAIQSICFDSQNVGWLGTENEGLLRVNDGDTSVLNTTGGLPSNDITQIIFDDKGTIWLGSPDGICFIRGSELADYWAGKIKQVYPVTVGVDEGLHEASCLRFFQPSVWKSTDGLIWFATRQGLVALRPERVCNVQASLAVSISKLVCDGVPQPVYRPLQLRTRGRNLEIGYVTLCLSLPSRVRTQYRMQGFDSEWIPCDASGTARYPLLPLGRYTFKVASRLAGSDQTDTSRTIVIDVLPAWWQTLGFRLSLLCLLLLLAGLVARVWSHKRLQQRLKVLEYETAVERERTRIAQNIHDDIGAGLTQISLLTQSSRVETNPAQMERIYKTVSGLTQSIDEIVWAVNPRNDGLESLASYIGDYAQTFLGDAGIRCRVLLPDLLSSVALPVQQRHHLFLASKEALNNVVKHARASEVVLRIDVEGPFLVVAIKDNGCGFSTAPASRDSTGDGLANIRSRLSSINGSCEICSEPQNGTTVTFKIWLP